MEPQPAEPRKKQRAATKGVKLLTASTHWQCAQLPISVPAVSLACGNSIPAAPSDCCAICVAEEILCGANRGQVAILSQG
jgi:hypothetical protein